MKKTVAAMVGTLGVVALAGTAMGGSHADKAVAAAMKARDAQMDLYAFNLGLLGDMAKGAVPYDADAAQAAANNLLTISRIDQSFHWPEGTDNMALDGTRPVRDVMIVGALPFSAIMALVLVSVVRMTWSEHRAAQNR